MAAPCSSTNWPRLSAGAQERLLRAVEYGEVTRIGSNRPIRVDVRIVAATNEHLPALVERARFRADLLDRLAFEVVTLPPLRVREGDVAGARRSFRAAHGSRTGLARVAGFSAVGAADARRRMTGPAMSANCATSSSARFIAGTKPAARSRSIEFDPFASPWSPKGSAVAKPETQLNRDSPYLIESIPEAAPLAFRDAVAAYEKKLLDDALARHRFNQRACAKALALSYDQLRHAMRRHGMLAG